MSRPLAAIAVLGAIAAGCGGPGARDGLVTITTSTGVQLKVPPGTAVVEATVHTAGPRAIDRVTLQVRPSGARADLAYDAARSAFTGLVITAAGNQTLMATAWAGPARAGSVKVGASLVSGTAASLDALALDTSAGWPLPDGSPAVTALALSPTALLVKATLGASAQAEDPDGAELAYLWSSDCAGRFSPSSARNVSWTPSAPGSCAVTVTAASPSGTASRSGGVQVTLPPGQVDVAATFVQAPFVQEITVAAAEGTCTVTRGGPDASCRTRITPGETVAVAASLVTAAGATLEWSDDCSGTFVARDLTQLPDRATYGWTPPPGGPVVCTLTPTLSLDELTDTFPLAVLVADGPP